MGCSSSNLDNLNEEIEDPEKKKRREFTLPQIILKEREIYQSKYLRLNNLLNNVHSKFRDDFESFQDTFLFEELFLNRYKNLLTSSNLTFQDIREFKEEEELIKLMKEENYQDFEIHEIIYNYQSQKHNSLSEKNKEVLKTLLIDSEHYFPAFQKGVYFHFLEDKNTKEYSICFKALKHNPKLNNLQLLCIKIDSSITKLKILEEISELILCNKLLITVCLILRLDDNFNIESNECQTIINHFTVIIENISYLNSIKAFVLIIESENNILFPFHFYEAIFRVLKKDQLLNLTLINLSFKESTLGVLLCETLKVCKNLKILYIYFPESIVFVQEFVKTIKEMPNILILFLSGGGFIPNQVHRLNEEMRNLKVFEYQSHFFNLQG